MSMRSIRGRQDGLFQGFDHEKIANRKNTMPGILTTSYPGNSSVVATITSSILPNLEILIINATNSIC